MRLSVVLDCNDPAGLVPFWRAALGYVSVGTLPGYEVLAPAPEQPPGPVFILQGVAEPRAGKNRMHLDVHPPVELGVPKLVERLEALGGRRVGEPVTELLEHFGIWWQLVLDPEGNELDLVADRSHPPPSP